MVIPTTAPESTYVNNGASTTASKPAGTAMSSQINKLTVYLDAFDGRPDAVQRFEPLFREAFHQDLMVESLAEGGNLSYDQLFALVKSFAEQGALANVLKTVDNGDGTATFTIENNLPGDDKGDVTQQQVWFRDGKAVKVAALAVDAKQFSALLDRIKAPTKTAE